MRRKERERDEKFALDVFKKCEYAVLATINSDKTPYCVPVSIVVMQDDIYFHCANKGKKLDNINLNNNVCINGVANTKLVPSGYTTEYESATARGKCVIITDYVQKKNILKSLCEKYAAINIAEFDNAIKRYFDKTTICKINIEEITGKENKEQY